MFAVNYSTLRAHMKENFDRVSDEYETMIVTRKNNRNIVILSEETYNNLLENLHILESKANYDWLVDSITQLEQGKVDFHELDQADSDE